MALARVKVWIPGDVLTAADLNGEFNNVINNPITLISPTTGVINFNLQAHTNLIPAALTASSGSTGQVLTVNTAGVPVWGNVGTAGLTTGSPSTGALLLFSSDGVWVPLNQGTSGYSLVANSTGVSPSYQSVPFSVIPFTNNGALSAAATYYAGGAVEFQSADVNLGLFPAGVSGVIKNLIAWVSSTMPAGNSCAFTLLVDKAASALTVTLTSSGSAAAPLGQTGQDLTHSVTVANTQLLQMQLVKTGAQAIDIGVAISMFLSS